MLNDADILENIYQFIKKHQVCEEKNTIIPNVTENRMLFRCLSCDSQMEIVAKDEDGNSN